MVYYRKYRPQTIEELDSKEVREKLYSALKSSSVSHAFLFTGPKGLGKTSTARIVAKVVNCEEKSKIKNQKSKSQLKSQKLENGEARDQIEPCNRCYQCKSIINGTNIDVLEIDGASNRGIDEIRDLREKVRLAPAASKNKVYIIDEVHMLTQEAFNALLKTLEEPPMHVIFILCTTEPHKVPATIVSRCFHISFKLATKEELERSLQRVAKAEKLNVDKDALGYIARLSNGGFREGAKILEELTLNAVGRKITKEMVEKLYHVSSINYILSEMLESLAAKDTKSSLQLVHRAIEQGIDMKYFIEQLISELHEMLLVEIGVNGSEKLEVRSYKLEVEEIKELIELLSRAHGELKYAVLPQLPLELAIVEWGIQKTQNTQIVRESDSQKIRVSDSPKVRHSDSPSFPNVPKVTPMDTFWKQLIDHVKLYNHSIAGVLRGCGLKSYDNKKIVIETGYKFHKERLEEKQTMSIIEKTCKEIMGNDVGVSVLLKNK